MTTDNKTLADVQPGGRVRLGDQAELDRLEFQAWARELLPCPFCGNGAEFVPYKDNGLTLKCKSMGCIQRNQRTLRYGIDWLRTSMAEHWNTRALSAQPSPGGQDALDCIGRIEEAIEFRVPHDIYAAVHGELAELKAALAGRQPVRIYGCCAQPEGELHTAECPNMRHLAARQPVGEPAGYATFRDGRFGSWLFQTRAMAESHDSTAVAGGPANSEIVPLFRLPAQAVDLEELRRAVCVVGVVGQIDGHDVVRRNSVLDVIDTRRQRLADSQAVGE